LLYEAIANLPQRRKEVMELTLRGFSLNDIADNLDVSLNTIPLKLIKRELKVKLKDLKFLLLLLYLDLKNKSTI